MFPLLYNAGSGVCIKWSLYCTAFCNKPDSPLFFCSGYVGCQENRYICEMQKPFALLTYVAETPAWAGASNSI